MLLAGNLLAAQEYVPNDGRSVGVGDEVDRGERLRDIEVGNLAQCNRTIVLAQPHGGCTVDGGCIERLGGL